MPSITGDSAIDVAIGLAFVFFLLSIVCSAVNEAIAAVTNLRARTLEAGIRNLIDDDVKAKQFYENWRIQSLHSNTVAAWFGHTSTPSYIPPTAFALTLLDTIVPPDSGASTPTAQAETPAAVAGSSAQPPPSKDLIARAQIAIQTLKKDLGPKFEQSKVAGILQDALNEVDDVTTDRDKFRASIETAFNDAMDRVSGWYKRRSQLFMFVIALALVGALNMDAFTIGQRLWKDDVLRAAVVAQATATVASGKAVCATNTNTNAISSQTRTSTTPTPASATPTPTPAPLDTAANCVAAVKQLNLPIGWTKATTPQHFIQYPTKILGLLVTAFAVMLGAPFWFDFLGKAARLRSTGPRPDKTPPAASLN